MNNNNFIGDLGENAFAALCAGARLHASRPEPDRTGKDFIVEWPPEGSGFDTRPPPRKCLVQIKSTRFTSREVRLKLSSAEWLIKDLSPSFVLCPVFDAGERLLHYICFHLTGDLLGRVLARLRKAEQGGSTPGKVKIHLALSGGTALTQEAVPGWLEEQCGDDMARYASEKALALSTLGYDDAGPQYTMTVSAGSTDEIMECLLGRRTLPVSFGPAHRSRFGIRAPAHDAPALPTSGYVSITPQEEEVWHLEALDETCAVRAVLEVSGHTIALQGSNRPVWRSEVGNGVIHLIVAGDHVTISLRAAEILNGSHDLDELIQSLEFWLTFGICEGRLRLCKGGKQGPVVMISGIQSDLDKSLESALKLLRDVRYIYTYCGISKVKVAYRALSVRHNEIRSAAMQLDLRQADEPWLLFGCDTDRLQETFSGLMDHPLVLVSMPVIVGDDVLAASVAYSVKPELLASHVRAHAVSRIAIRGCRLSGPDFALAYENFWRQMHDEISPGFHALIPLVQNAPEAGKDHFDSEPEE